MSETTLPLPNSLVMGWNDSWFLGQGWHGVSHGPGKIPSRWCFGKAWINIPPGQWSGLEFILAGRHFDGKPIGLDVFFGDRKLGWVGAIGRDHFEVAQMEFASIDASNQRQQLRLVCAFENGDDHTPAIFIPDQTLANRDYRELGLSIAGIRFY